ncbi:MAG: hypothetical protein M3O02_02815 [Acidobacteriota bacterium]|nr:hypothetical protein [Acidobacteriota bacterium]
MRPTRVSRGKPHPQPEQTPEQIAAALEAFFAEYPKTIVSEQGKVLFDMRAAKYSLATEYGRCTLQLWSEDRNIVRRVSAAIPRKAVLHLTTHRFGHATPTVLELAGEVDRRTPSSRETTRTRFAMVLERMLARVFPDWTCDGIRTAMDLEKSFGPAYARGMLVQGRQAWAFIAVNAAETQATVDGILTLGVLWLAHCRERAAGRRVVRGLRMLVPRGTAALTLSRMPWMSAEAAQWELWEYDDRTEELTPRDPIDAGNLASHLVHAVSESAARERFAEPTARVLALLPEPARSLVEQRVRSSAEIAFLLHGLEFARIRASYAGQRFERLAEITVGAGPNETPLTPANTDELERRIATLLERRRPGADPRDPLFRTQTERWLESVLRHDLLPLDAHLNPAHVYTQVPAFAGSDRGMMDLLSVLNDGRLAVIEVKAEEDLHLALQGLDYWVRVRWHHMQTADHAGSQSLGMGEFQRHGYFAGVALSPRPPRLYLVAPALRIHPATEVVLRHLSPRVDWELAAVDERWREQLRVVWRKRSHGPEPRTHT